MNNLALKASWLKKTKYFCYLMKTLIILDVSSITLSFWIIKSTRNQQLESICLKSFKSADKGSTREDRIRSFGY